jgi:hypothetical protein
MLPNKPSGDQNSTDQKDSYYPDWPVVGTDMGNIYIDRMSGSWSKVTTFKRRDLGLTSGHWPRHERLKMRGQDCWIATYTFFKLWLGEIFGVMQARTTQVDFCKIGAGEVRVIKQGIAQIGSAEVGLIKPRMRKISAGHVSSFQISGCQAREAQPGVPQTCWF